MNRMRLVNITMMAGAAMVAYAILSEPSESFFYELPRDTAKLAVFNDAQLWREVISAVGVVVFIVALALKLFRKKDVAPVLLGTSDGLWFGSTELQPVWRKGKSPIADAFAAMGGKPGEKVVIEKHYADGNGIWHPVVLDPMGEQSPKFCDQWLSKQEAEKKLLTAFGESLSY